MAFPPQFLEELRSRVSLASVVGRKVRLVRRGREHTGLCPFHNEKTPSFTVNEEKGFYHCFGCGAHGDAVAFEMQASHLSFPEAVERLATEVGLTPPAPSREERETARRRASLHDAMEAACVFYERSLRQPVGREALAYLRGRGLDDATIARFRLGYAPDARDALKKALLAQDMGEDLLLEAGLLVARDDGSRHDRFRGRVMFPITDRRGRVIAFGGRVMGDGQPKYLNSPDTPLFHKGSVLYALAQARLAAAEAGTVIAVEGYMDVIALHGAGFANAVAPLGTALTEGQIEEMWRLAPEPILCFDGDPAGQRAAGRAALRALPLLRPGHSLRFAMLPPSEDPDSLVRSGGRNAMAAVLDKAEPLFEVLWRMETAGRPLDTPERRAALERDLGERARLIRDATVRRQYETLFRERLWHLLRGRRAEGRMAKGSGGGPRGGRLRAPDGRLVGAGRPAPPPPAELIQQRVMLAVLLNHPHLIDTVGERLGELAFSDKDLDNLRQEVLKHLGEGACLDSASLQDHLRSSGFKRTLETLLGSGMDSRFYFIRPEAPPAKALDEWEDAYRRYCHREIEADTAEAEQRLAQDATDESFGRLLALKTHELSIREPGTDADGDDGGDRPVGGPGPR